MLSWWNSMEGVSKFHTLSQWTVAVFILLAAAAVVFNIKASNKLASLRVQQETEVQGRLADTEKGSEQFRKELDWAQRRHEQTEQALRTQLREAQEKHEQTERELRAQVKEAWKSAAAAIKHAEAPPEAPPAVPPEAPKPDPEPRILTPEQQQRLISILQTGPGGEIDVEAPVSDPEALALAEQLVKNLRSAGWEVPYFSRELSVGSAAGLEILINDFKTAPERAQTLAKALDAIGIPSRAKASPATPEDSLTLVIGPRE